MALSLFSTRLSAMIGVAIEWRTLETFLPLVTGDPILRRSAWASTFAASLQLAKEGHATIRQDDAFGPIYLRAKAPQAELQHQFGAMGVRFSQLANAIDERQVKRGRSAIAPADAEGERSGSMSSERTLNQNIADRDAIAASPNVQLSARWIDSRLRSQWPLNQCVCCAFI